MYGSRSCTSPRDTLDVINILDIYYTDRCRDVEVIVEVARGEVARGEVARGEVARGEVARGEVARGEVARGEVARGEAVYHRE